MVFVGYTFILIIDKVLFDTHSLFDHGHEDEHGHDAPADPAEAKFVNAVKASMVQVAAAQNAGDSNLAKRSMMQANVDIEQSLGAYLNKNDRFATRMAASMHKSIGGANTHQDQ